VRIVALEECLKKFDGRIPDRYAAKRFKIMDAFGVAILPS
jgi:hypothetical protein